MLDLRFGYSDMRVAENVVLRPMGKHSLWYILESLSSENRRELETVPGYTMQNCYWHIMDNILCAADLAETETSPEGVDSTIPAVCCGITKSSETGIGEFFFLCTEELKKKRLLRDCLRSVAPEMLRLFLRIRPVLRTFFYPEFKLAIRWGESHGFRYVGESGGRLEYRLTELKES
jgi:hypothetical protein